MTILGAVTAAVPTFMTELRNLPSQEVVNTVKEAVKKEVAPVKGFEAGKDKEIRNCEVQKDCENGEVETRRRWKWQDTKAVNHELLKNAIGELLKKSIARSVSFGFSKLGIWRRRRQENHHCEVTKGYEDGEIEMQRLKMKKSRGEGGDEKKWKKSTGGATFPVVSQKKP
ncbi:hypothetical protein V8G54_000873 [Vigna mungo]|uniref:Uncharacterized protein n=1 Tax=Vigna mungo TaxID=3915 RepID=A0AAQ3S7P0_VIGMU